MRKQGLITMVFVLIAFMFFYGSSTAGTIDLPQTGQTTCYDSLGAVIACTDTGQDGDIQAGVAWPSPRFMDNGDGTVTDNLTGLIWLKDANCFGGENWADALNSANTLNSSECGLSDGSVEGDWRLPNINELESLVNAGEGNTAAWLNAQGFTNAQSNIYWSSSTNPFYTDNAWYVNLLFGKVFYDLSKTSSLNVWPVRGTSTQSAQIWKTGQTTSYAAGDDGDIQAGVAWPTPRFTDNGNGTVTDNLTGLIWLKDANCFYSVSRWDIALFVAKSLNSGECGLSDGSVAGDWRLPNRKELRSLTDFTQYPSLPAGHPFDDVYGRWYWSSSTYVFDPDYAWHVSLISSGVRDSHKSSSNDYLYVWPVRGGQYYDLIISGEGTGNGTVASNPAGIDCGGDCSETYVENTVITLTPTPDAGSVFAGWSGDADCSDGQVTMDADRNCTATFNLTPPNQPPVANAGTDQTVEATSPSGASVMFNGSASYDPDGDTLLFTWTWSSGGISGDNPTVTLPLGTHTVTLTVSDGQATATDDVTIMVQDTTPPLIVCPANQTVEATSSAGAVVNYSPATATDTVSTPTITYSQASGTVFPLGTTTVTATATDAAGNSASCSFDVAVQDTTSPAITSSQNPLPNANGWNNTDVTITFTAADAVSNIVPCEIVALSLTSNSPISATLSNEGASQAVNVTCTDGAGNSATASHTVNIDKTPPNVSATRTPAPNANGWNNTDVTAHFSATDSLSEMQGDSFFDVFITTEGAGQSVTYSFADLAGNTGSANVSNINIDKTPPLLTLPSFAASYTLGSGLTISFSATDSLSLIETMEADFNGTPITDGASVTLTQIGVNTFSMNAADRAGNSISETRTFTVNYSFGGFLSPLVPDGTYNLGRVIPVKFALSDANGNPVSSAVARLSLQQISGGEPVGEPIEASSVSSADSGNIFRYNGDHYIYNLDTRTLSAGIWQMQVGLDDGSVHTILIGLKSK